MYMPVSTVLGSQQKSLRGWTTASDWDAEYPRAARLAGAYAASLWLKRV